MWVWKAWNIKVFKKVFALSQHMLIVNRKVFYGVNFVGHPPIEKFNVILIFRHQHEFFWTTQFWCRGTWRSRPIQNNWLETLNFERRNRSQIFSTNEMATLRSAVWKIHTNSCFSALYCWQASLSHWTLESNFRHQSSQKWLSVSRAPTLRIWVISTRPCLR